MSVTGALFGVLAGRVVAEFGAVRTLIVALLLSAVAALATAFANQPAPFLGFRVLEGFGYLLVCSAAPAMMAGAAAPRDKGTALAIWGPFVPVSVSVMGAAGPTIAADHGWRGLFMASAVAVGLVAGLVAAIVRDDRPIGPGNRAPARRGRRGGTGRASRLYRSPSGSGSASPSWPSPPCRSASSRCCHTYLIEALGLDGATAGLVLSVTAPFAVAGTVLAGTLTRVGAPDRPTTALAFVGMGLTAAGLFSGVAATGVLIVLGILFFTAGGVVGSVIFASLPRRAGDAAGVALLSACWSSSATSAR